MTTIAWDGKILVADRQANGGGFSYTVEKLCIHPETGDVAFGAGEFSKLSALYKWFLDGEKTEEWPNFQTEKDWQPLIIIRAKDKTIWRHELTCVPWQVRCLHYAVGSGRDYAIAAMHLGRSAEEAVKLASQYDSETGAQLDIYEVIER